MQRFALLLIGCITVCDIALAQSVPSGLIAGEVQKAGTNDCFVHDGLSTFQRNFTYPAGPGTKAVISFESAFCRGADLRGQAVMLFDNSTSGVIRSKHAQSAPAIKSEFRFTDYSESVNSAAHQIVVKFKIVGAFPVTDVLDPSYP
jgi:hypothetical protein